MFSFYDILHSLLIVQPIFMAIQFLTYENKKSLPNQLMGSLMLIVSFFYLVNADFLLPFLPFLKYKYFIVYALLFAINPFYYFYSKSLIIENYTFKAKELLHFTPVVLFFIFSLLSLAPEESMFLSFHNLNIFSAIVYNSQVLIYTVIMIILLRRHEINVKNYFSFSEDINLNWLKIFIVIYILTTTLDLTIFYSHNISLQIYYYLLMILFFNFLGYFGIRQINIYINREIDANIEEELEAIDIASPKDTIDTVEETSTLVETKKQELMRSIINLVENDKVYLNSKLTIFDISRQLNINKTYISNVINELTKENFNSFINRYRIKEAENMICSEAYQQYTFEAIAEKVGFNSKASFNSAFKKFNGRTPSAYKKTKLLNQ